MILLSSDDDDHIQTSAIGEDIDIISNIEMETFHLKDEQLKRAVDVLTVRRPQDAYLRIPTPWGLYEEYDWEQVTRTLGLK
ncbi:hypothetical protein [Xenorhabdus bovienii]|uniref:hypothetical protein n=1 Tax=Xenorhabdus bovienii TaxID=40576 RepID=UPI0023B2EDEB|nr:hypothetical protein [Xenorhabdus bovienii]MDE9431765.1 hypothetical protein [Xenorhabdus bovienii]MDE9489491.1 hypothetical protein [Xenorhabdus bovienii]MDE9505818.1 hypothetical protein [Xenorhabdus bovienii]MDE9545947.1 hypothetical protein [Xenorhabdus bovienii]